MNSIGWVGIDKAAQSRGCTRSCLLRTRRIHIACLGRHWRWNFLAECFWGWKWLNKGWWRRYPPGNISPRRSTCCRLTPLCYQFSPSYSTSLSQYNMQNSQNTMLSLLLLPLFGVLGSANLDPIVIKVRRSRSSKTSHTWFSILNNTGFQILLQIKWHTIFHKRCCISTTCQRHRRKHCKQRVCW